MDVFKDRRVVALAGMGVALAAGLTIAALMLSQGRQTAEPPPASQGGLVVQTGRDDDIKLDERRPLRCFVNGQLVGELTVRDCAHRNGVATGALDVGLDQSGALAATNGVSSQITPLPPGATPGAAGGDSPMGSPDSDSAITSAARVAGCWRYGDSEWTRLPDDVSLSACIRMLYSGLCERAGPPAYGRWGDRTLRLLQGRVDISPDNRNFRPLIDHAPGCAATSG